MTVLEIIQKSTEFLAKKGVQSPRLQSELILAHILGVPRLQLYLDYNKPVEEKYVNTMRELVVKRAQRIPLQHLLGNTVFCALEFKTTEKALIPRPETELLAETVINLANKFDNPRILDFGTGSGCLAVTVAKRCPSANVTAIDISEEALELAKENALKHDVYDRIKFILSDGFKEISTENKFDIIMSNPPYIPTGEIQELEPEVRDYEPRIALDGGSDGLDMYRRLSIEAQNYINNDNYMVLEIGAGQTTAVSEIMKKNGWIVESIIADYNKIQRIVMLRPNKIMTQKT